MLQNTTHQTEKQPNHLFTVRLKFITGQRAEVYIIQNNWKAGILDIKERTFYCTPRTAKNLSRFQRFIGLGINAEILEKLDFDTVKVKYENTILETSREKWLKAGRISPFSNRRVDRQYILALDKINYDPCNDLLRAEQVSMFGKATENA